MVAAFGAPGPPVAQSLRFPGLLWPFTAAITGGYPEALRRMDTAVARCRAHAGPWELAVLLLFRWHLRFGVPGAADDGRRGRPARAGTPRPAHRRPLAAPPCARAARRP
ncbi:hypothetical protein [Streptomyces litchfieldiae]|uniref:Uncharacterized protein n=1 Tax=Streptomyces litchfieldiae TaxID=3075543 RepID=A0ABU2N183_9ACTN|nr:hypothetical protein [Streptomyces sp. DSM 44938]MDT0347662.1 hypothetical protein [Streptomyces sp. DSM 44938]